MSSGGTYYRIYMTPLASLNHYDSEIEITDWVIWDQMGTITKSLDSADYTTGIYTFNDVTLVCDATDGYLLDESDSRSIFRFSRDKTKVRIVFYKDGAALSTFYGLINEAGSTIDTKAGTVTLNVLGYDSILNNTLVAEGTVTDGMSFTNAIIAILNSAVSGILTVTTANIDPSYNGTVDIGSHFDNLSAKQALDDLLEASNSVLTVNSSGSVYVKNRDDNGGAILKLYGRGDLLGRENIISIDSINNGRHRMFNVIRVKGAQAPAATGVTPSVLVGSASDSTSVGYFGASVKEISIDFVSTQATLDAIAAAILAEFRYPKREIQVTVATELLQEQSPPTDLLDLVSIDCPLSVRPLPGKRLPFIGITSIGDTTAPLPYAEGAIQIDPSTAWKVIEINENPVDFTTTLKLRVIGTGLSDGVFDFMLTEDSSIIETEFGEGIVI